MTLAVLPYNPPSGRGYRIRVHTVTGQFQDLKEHFTALSGALTHIRVYKNPLLFKRIEIWYDGPVPVYYWTEEREYYDMPTLEELRAKKTELDKEDRIPFMSATAKKIVADNKYGFLITGIRTGSGNFGPQVYYDVIMLQTDAYKAAAGIFSDLAGNKARLTISMNDSSYRAMQKELLESEYVNQPTKPMTLIPDGRQYDFVDWTPASENQSMKAAPSLENYPE